MGPSSSCVSVFFSLHAWARHLWVCILRSSVTSYQDRAAVLGVLLAASSRAVAPGAGHSASMISRLFIFRRGWWFLSCLPHSITGIISSVHTSVLLRVQRGVSLRINKVHLPRASVLNYDFYIKISTHALGSGVESWHEMQIKLKISNKWCPCCNLCASPIPVASIGKFEQCCLSMKMLEAPLHVLMEQLPGSSTKWKKKKKKSKHKTKCYHLF